ncbi:gasdermin C [Cricetulus griseus]
MPHSFDWVCKDVVKKLQGKDLCPVKRLSDATKFRQFEILQKTAQSLFWKTEDIPIGYSLLQILEPNFPVPEPEVSAPIPLKCTVSQKLKGHLGAKVVAEGGASAEFAHSAGYNIEVQCTSIPASKLEILQNSQRPATMGSGIHRFVAFVLGVDVRMSFGLQAWEERMTSELRAGGDSLVYGPGDSGRRQVPVSLRQCLGTHRKKCHCDLGFEVSYAQASPSVTVHFLLPSGQDTDLSALSPAPCLPACHRVLS